MPLTKKQQEAVECASPTTMVIAGPGTGKTYMLASRIEHLVNRRGISPERILCLTFTDAGANAMRERVIQFLGINGYRVDINTFHSFAARLIDEHPEVFGYKHNLKALADIDRARLIQRIIDELYDSGMIKHLTPSHDRYAFYHEIAKSISEIKREGCDARTFKSTISDWQEEFNAIPDGEKLSSRGARKGQIKREYEKVQERINKNKELSALYAHYEEKLAENSWYDYDDMILRSIAGLQKNESLRGDLHEHYQAILVDEYQDTNGAQNRLLFLLIDNNSPNVFIVGDDDQAIHRFQGATIENFKEFLKRFKKTKVIALQDNFRSPQIILNAALALARNNENRITRHLKLPEKKLTAHSAAKDAQSFFVHTFPNEMHEYAFLVNTIKRLIADGDKYDDIAVLVRTNREQNEIADILRKAEIPYALSAAQNAMEEPRVQTLFALIRATTDPRDNDALLAFLLHPATPIKTEDVWRVLDMRGRDERIYQTLSRAAQKQPRDISDHEALRKTYCILNELSAEQAYTSGAQWLQRVLEQSGVLTWVSKQEDAPYLIANLRAITDEAKRVQTGKPELRITDILSHLKSYQDLGISLRSKLVRMQDAVHVLTAHQAKGQEFKTVFIVHAAHGNWSGKRNIQKLKLPQKIGVWEEKEEDARRLFYVALTRAKENLFITTSNIYTGGFSGTDERERAAVPALFIGEMREYITPTERIEERADEFITATLMPSHALRDEQRRVIGEMVSRPTFAINATSFNAYLECPQKFLYEKVLRVPTVKTFSLTYGEAIHVALEQYFKVPKGERSENQLTETVTNYLARESTLTEAENRHILERAQAVFGSYYQNLSLEPEPIAVEYRFPSDKFTFDEVRLSGKIDKISHAPAGSDLAVRVIDYKTSRKAKTVNAIKGKTQDKTAPNLMRQLLFYRLLLAQDKNFNYTPVEFVLDFVDAGRIVEVPITDTEYFSFQEELKKTWNSIQIMEFLKTKCGECKWCKL